MPKEQDKEAEQKLLNWGFTLGKNYKKILECSVPSDELDEYIQNTINK